MDTALKSSSTPRGFFDDRVGRVIRWLVLWLVLCVAGIMVYNASYPYTRDVLIHHLQVKPAAWLIQHLHPSLSVAVREAAIAGGGVELSIMRGCDGVEAWLVMFTALVAFPAPVMRRIRGFVYGTLLIFSLNLLRIVSLFFWALIKPAWFHVAHGMIWQTIMLLSALVFVLIWMEERTSNPAWSMLFRGVSGFAASVVWVSWVPAWWLYGISPLMCRLNDWVSPYFEATQVNRVDGLMLYGDLNFRSGLVLTDGTTLPSLAISWHYAATGTLHLLVMAITTWAVMPVRRGRRWVALGFTLMLAGLFSSVDLMVELQETTLSALDRDVFPHLKARDDPANEVIMAGLQHGYSRLKWMKEFHAAGGRLFLGVIAGMTGCLLPALVHAGSRGVARTSRGFRQILPARRT